MHRDKSKVDIGNVSFRRKPMVHWYNPLQLLDTATRVVVSSVFSTYVDKRESFATTRKPRPYDYSGREELWLDYIADIGDGWNPTYYTAYLLAQKQLVVGSTSTRRGDLLLMGGDQVYPTPARKEYHDRLWGPYECAFPRPVIPQGCAAPEPHLFAIPGNHDWYDGLANFLKQFCQERRLGGWTTRQERSYFALQLTSTCWLWGIDISLNADIDKPQLDYFKEVATERMRDSDQVILCTAEPAWVRCEKAFAKERYEKLAFFKKSCIEEIAYTHMGENGIQEERKRTLRLVLVLSGDLHHYARYTHLREGKPDVPHLTAGGGGTFLHPTHHLQETINWPEKQSGKAETFQLQKCFPSKKVSRALTFGNLLFPFRNPYFSLLLGIFYLLVGWQLYSDHARLWAAGWPGLGGLWPSPLLLLQALAGSPSTVFLLTLLIAGFGMFADRKASDRPAVVTFLGGVHGFCHALLALAIIWPGGHLLAAVSLQESTALPFLAYAMGKAGSVLLLLATGWLLGGLLTGTFLILLNLLLQVQDNETFSALRHQDHKNFLRLRITEREITLYPIGIRKVPRSWNRSSGKQAGAPYFDPAATAEDQRAFLIENPLVIPLHR
ncbi:metallophosphoesterase [Pontibacter litorisediminis]|uniref:metallophosphoesterase n=1 Tax=Pontibacter litorisediminis TaxID=1846260 RepID=UPI0023EE00E3|nr:metallophosphoesterase [Pontibacter litorisediminis]